MEGDRLIKSNLQHLSTSTDANQHDENLLNQNKAKERLRGQYIQYTVDDNQLNHNAPTDTLDRQLSIFFFGTRYSSCPSCGRLLAIWDYGRRHRLRCEFCNAQFCPRCKSAVCLASKDKDWLNLIGMNCQNYPG